VSNPFNPTNQDANMVAQLQTVQAGGPNLSSGLLPASAQIAKLVALDITNQAVAMGVTSPAVPRMFAGALEGGEVISQLTVDPAVTPATNPATVYKAATGTTHTDAAIVSVVQDGATVLVPGVYDLHGVAGTGGGTLKLTWNGGAAVDNIAANTAGVVLHGGVAGQLTVNVGAIPGAFPVDDLVDVTKVVDYTAPALNTVKDAVYDALEGDANLVVDLSQIGDQAGINAQGGG
jgi:hypothetical protein